MEQRENPTLLSKGAECEPLDLLAPMIANPAATFEFSFYQYAPDSALDPRRPAKVQGGPQAMAECLSLLDGIREGEELAMHSKVALAGSTLHIPMLDLACADLGPVEMARLAKFIPARIMESLSFYRTGRSFHAYGAMLLPESELVPFWGMALLANPVDGLPVVDARWIGHRMISGHGSLRLSARQERSLLAPCMASTS